jgi:hypothetical protein
VNYKNILNIVCKMRVELQKYTKYNMRVLWWICASASSWRRSFFFLFILFYFVNLWICTFILWICEFVPQPPHESERSGLTWRRSRSGPAPRSFPAHTCVCVCVCVCVCECVSVCVSVCVCVCERERERERERARECVCAREREQASERERERYRMPGWRRAKVYSTRVIAIWWRPGAH